MIEHQLDLKYALNPGWMAPYVEGLQLGRAMARRCGGCHSISFPPLRICTCGHATDGWVPLSGQANVLFRCDGHDGSFALVRFQGADTQAVVRLSGLESDQTVGHLHPSAAGGPALVLGPPQEIDFE